MICNYVFLEKNKHWMNEYICIFDYIYGLTYTHTYIYIYCREQYSKCIVLCAHSHGLHHHDNDHLDCPGLVHLEFATDWGSEQVR